MDDVPAILTVAQVAAVLQTGKNQTYALINSGQLKAFMVGRSRRVPKEALISYINSTRNRAAR